VATVSRTLRALATAEWPTVRGLYAPTSGVITEVVASPGVLRAGNVLMRVDERPVVVVPGEVAAYRPLDLGAQGRDVASLQRYLRGAGFVVDDDLERFTAVTAAAVREWQRSLGFRPTGSVALGDVLFVPPSLLGSPNAPDKGVRVETLDAVGRLDDADDRGRDVEPFVARLGDLLPSREGPLGIERAAELAALTEALATDAGALDAAVLWGALGATAAMVAALRFGAIDERRREFGLRRSQGATRSTIAAIVVLESAILGAIGVVLGGAVGAVLVVAQTGLAPDPALVASVGWLLALAAVAGAIPAAVAAARRDPIEVLRTI